jgi:hypothetical protein
VNRSAFGNVPIEPGAGWRRIEWREDLTIA